MPQPTKGPRLGGSPSHQRLILANLATALFEHGRIKTTEAKARRLRPLAEKLITKAKRGDLAARRQVLSVVQDKGVVHTLFTEIGPRFETRPGGYTRITKLGPRKGDNAPMALIELVEESAPTATTPDRRRGSGPQGRRGRRPRRPRADDAPGPKTPPTSRTSDRPPRRDRRGRGQEVGHALSRARRALRDGGLVLWETCPMVRTWRAWTRGRCRAAEAKHRRTTGASG